jgi:hypothetical protein
MALLSENRAINTRFIKRGRLLDPVTSAGNSGWHRFGGIYPISITVGGSASVLTWHVVVTNALDAPTTSNESLWGAAQSGKGAVEITVPYEFVKVILDSVSGGNAFVDAWAG